MNPLKILAAMLLFVVIGACNSDSLDISEANKKNTEKIQTTDVQEIDDDGCETAFAKFHPFCAWEGWVFASNPNSNPDKFQSLGLTQNRWGWATKITRNLTEEFDLWAGAAKNDTSKGTLVGSVEFSYDGSKLTVTYTINEGYKATEIHIYASNNAPTTIAPGQYGYTFSGDDITEHIAEFDLNDPNQDGIWVIAHAVVCAD